MRLWAYYNIIIPSMSLQYVRHLKSIILGMQSQTMNAEQGVISYELFVENSYCLTWNNLTNSKEPYSLTIAY